MKNETQNKSLRFQRPKFECFQSIDANYAKTQSENGPSIFQLFSTRCESGHECFVIKCPVEAER